MCSCDFFQWMSKNEIDNFIRNERRANEFPEMHYAIIKTSKEIDGIVRFNLPVNLWYFNLANENTNPNLTKKTN